MLEKKFVIEANLKRRHLTDFQKAELGHLLEPIESELARRRQATLNNKETASVQMNLSEEKGQTRDIVAKKVGLSPTTYQRAKIIIEKAPEELKEKVRSGETSINYAYKQVKRSEDHKETHPPCIALQFRDGSIQGVCIIAGYVAVFSPIWVLNDRTAENRNALHCKQGVLLWLQSCLIMTIWIPNS